MKRATNQRKLKTYFIRKDIQLKIALNNFIHTMIVAGIIIGAILSPLYADIFEATDAQAQLTTAKLFLDIIDKVAIALVIIFALAFVQQILLTHKFCGPLVNFSHTFKRIIEGDLTRRVFLRKGDFLKAEAHQVNQMMAVLSARIARIREDNRRLLSEIEQAGCLYEKDDQVAEVLSTIKAYAERCKHELSEFALLEDLYPPETKITKKEEFMKTDGETAANQL